MGTRTIRTTYWITTGIFSAMMLASAIMYLTHPMVVETFEHLGFPDYLRIELAIFKVAGVAALVLPLSPRLKEWAYAGFMITLTSAFTAHVSSGDGPAKVMGPVIFGLLLFASYLTFRMRSRA